MVAFVMLLGHITECCLTCFRQLGKSTGWFASSATGGVVYNCGAIVEVDGQSMDGAGYWRPKLFPKE